MDKLLIDFLRELLEEQDTGPESLGGFFQRMAVDGGDPVHEPIVGLPKAERGFPQLVVDAGDATPIPDKNGLRETQRYNLTLWHENTQQALLDGSAHGETLAALLHHKVSNNGLFFQVVLRKSLNDSDKSKARTIVQVDCTRVK